MGDSVSLESKRHCVHTQGIKVEGDSDKIHAQYACLKVCFITQDRGQSKTSTKYYRRMKIKKS